MDNLRVTARCRVILLAIVAAGGVSDIGGAQQSPVTPPVLRAPDVAYEPTISPTSVAKRSSTTFA
jgi:hypothetical protein